MEQVSGCGYWTLNVIEDLEHPKCPGLRIRCPD